MEKLRFYTRDHRGGLRESLETIEEINELTFCALLPMYKFYGYDQRIKQALWILKDMNGRKYKTWLCIGTRKGIETWLNKHESS